MCVCFLFTISYQLINNANIAILSFFILSNDKIDKNLLCRGNCCRSPDSRHVLSAQKKQDFGDCQKREKSGTDRVRLLVDTCLQTELFN